MQKLINLLSDNQDLAGVITASAGVIIATCALFVSVLSFAVGVVSLRQQHRHNVLSIRPIPEVTVADYEDTLRIKIRNNGSGPMIIERMRVREGYAYNQTLIEMMPRNPDAIAWSHFSHALENRSLQVGSEIILLQLTGDLSNVEFRTFRDQCRARLKPLHVYVKYTDVYGTRLPEYTKSLEWFGRHEQRKI